MKFQGQISLSSDVANISKIENLIDEQQTRIIKGDDVYAKILISVVEAVNNAVIHGNKSDSSKNVLVHYSYTNKNIVYTITDCGNGFDYKNVPDPTAPENVDKVCGRGIYLMKLLSDKLEFSNEGRVVSLTFNL